MEAKKITPFDSLKEACEEHKISFPNLKTASDIMSKDVKTLTLDNTISEFHEFMRCYNVRHAPVVDPPYDDHDLPFFVGIVSQRDALRTSVPFQENISENNLDNYVLRSLLGIIVSRKPFCVQPNHPLFFVINSMVNHRIDMVPVIDNEQVTGIITTVDILRVYRYIDEALVRLCPDVIKEKDLSVYHSSTDKIAEYFPWEFHTVSDAMTETVFCLQEDEQIKDAIHLFKTQKIRHAPIVDSEQRLVGVVSDRDLLKNLPFPGRRKDTPSATYRDYLLEIDPNTPNLKIPLTKIISKKVYFTDPDNTIYHASRIMRSNKIGCLPVVNSDKMVSGIITNIDLLKALVTALKPVNSPDSITMGA